MWFVANPAKIMDVPEEPLNLTLKKMPIAIVAPFSVVDSNQNFKTTNNNSNNNNYVNFNNNNESNQTDLNKCDDLPEDLSIKNKTNGDQGLDLTKNINTQVNFEKPNIDHTEHLRNYFSKNVETQNSYDKNTFNDHYNNNHKLVNSYENSTTKNHDLDIYSFLNNLDNKFVSLWYMNSIFNQQNPYLSLTNSTSNFSTKSETHATSNKILNNLLDKKSYSSYKFPTGFDALIKNEMQADKIEGKPIKGSQMDHKNNIDGKNNQDSNEKKKPHIKKPLNAFMLYMKEMRAKVVAECTLKESAAINQILGRRWHSLSREEQAKYYEKARQERQLHMQLYPGWSARDNYGYGTKKKKRKKERTPIESGDGQIWHALGREEQAKYYELARRERQLHMQLYPDWSSRANATRGKKRKRKQDPADGGNSMKKCRARYGLDQQSQWCKPCRYVFSIYMLFMGPPCTFNDCLVPRTAHMEVDLQQSMEIFYMPREVLPPPSLLRNPLTSIYSKPLVSQQQCWCSMRKKKCIRYMEAGDGNDGNQSDDNLGSCGSMGDAHTPPEDDNESLNQSMSSPGGLSALSSLTSPGGMVLPSPSTSVASPSVSVASPYMLQSPLTPHEAFDVKPPLPLHHHQPIRNPVGTNPHDINNPLSVNQLTGQCVRNDSSDTNGNKETARSIISVT
ncbi:hypothetical protein NQ314_013233 [Rhamnusium bicolor]|uniref:dTCF n=1 Tax=Rhamnusium bicolor TaxID=1586634 RepID=A0AAV8X790_9CUCU|nr:hypothetical protein NQ314_013233 [Rhamnusium bicolor]